MISNQENLIEILKILNKEDNSVLLWTAREDKENRSSLLFTRPQDIIVCRNLSDVEACFKKIEQYLTRNFYAAGYVSYEAGFAFEENLKKLFIPGGLLLWFGIYHKPKVITARPEKSGRKIKPDDLGANTYNLIPAGLNVTKDQYSSCIKKIKSYIASGLTYQVNYTIKKYFRFSGNPYALFLQLCQNQKVPYAAFIKNDFEDILSLSPELFFKCDKRNIMVRPMKGTVKRANLAMPDWSNAVSLRNSLKDRAENVMIVDLLRNDLGRVSTTGSVKTRSLFDVQRLETLWQMTSTVKARLKNNLTWLELFRNTFPSGSVTGAPKIKTMEIISNLEDTPRGVYTGAIGFMAKQREGMFNVAIRTLRIDKRKKRAELGIGSGIVWDSKAEKEWQECQLKGDFVRGSPADFDLIETMSLRAGRVKLMDYHLERLEESAAYFDFNFNRIDILRQINRFINKLKPELDYKLRLLLFKDGEINIKSEPIAVSNTGGGRIVFSKKIINSENVFLYHKTTQRQLYNQEHKFWRQRGFFDCIFKNERGEVTEGAISNIFIEKNNKLFTPLLSCGLLNGVYRRHLLDSAKATIKETILYEDDIINANKIYLTNAVSGIIPAQLRK